MPIGDHVLSQLIDEAKAKSTEFPFNDHVGYFANKETGLIDVPSISCQWSALRGEHWMKTTVKGKITVVAANEALQKKTPKCPYHEKFTDKEMMPLLKHPSDTGIVKVDGSINHQCLFFVMKKCAIEDHQNKDWVIPEFKINEYLFECAQRDADAEQPGGFFMPSWQTVASAEWNDFFNNFTDRSHPVEGKKNGRAVTLETFLQFYYQPKILWDRVLSKELPIKI